MRALATVIATWFGCGYSPVGPGTAGSLAAIVIAWALNHWLGWTPVMFGFAALVLLLPGTWAADQVAKFSGRKDPGLVVVDEVVGQWITLSTATVLNWKIWALAFVLFRLFDIWKPPPARQFEAFPGGVGIMADDVMAGLYGALVLFVVGYWKLLS